MKNHKRRGRPRAAPTTRVHVHLDPRTYDDLRSIQHDRRLPSLGSAIAWCVMAAGATKEDA
jgi:hypothetical protein